MPYYIALAIVAPTIAIVIYRYVYSCDNSIVVPYYIAIAIAIVAPYFI